jgi:lipoprotein-anchoring transpeptidase ErfK/SrfK
MMDDYDQPETAVRAVPAQPQPAAPAPAERAAAKPANTKPADPEAAANAAPADAEPSAAPAEEQSAEAPPPPVETTLHIDIDLTRQEMNVSENGVPRYVWPVSSGTRGHDTPKGDFKPVWMSKMWYSRQYDYAPMPNAIFFHGGAAIHGTAYIGALGRPASHGCVRLAPRNAATLYKMVANHGKAATRIVVHGTPNHGAEPQVASRQGRRYIVDDPYRERFDEYDRAPPPSYYARRRAYAYDRPYYVRPQRRGQYYYPPQQRRYVQRGLFNNYGGDGY